MKLKKIVLTSLLAISALTVSNVLTQQPTTLATTINKSMKNSVKEKDPNINSNDNFNIEITPQNSSLNSNDVSGITYKFDCKPKNDKTKEFLLQDDKIFGCKCIYFITSENEKISVVECVSYSRYPVLHISFSLKDSDVKKIINNKNCKLVLEFGNGDKVESSCSFNYTDNSIKEKDPNIDSNYKFNIEITKKISSLNSNDVSDITYEFNCTPKNKQTEEILDQNDNIFHAYIYFITSKNEKISIIEYGSTSRYPMRKIFSVKGSDFEKIKNDQNCKLVLEFDNGGKIESSCSDALKEASKF